MFVSSLDLTGEISVDVLRHDDEFIARVPIGYDDREDRVYSLFVALAPLVGHVDIPGFELIFAVLDAATNGDDIRRHSDGLATKSFLVEPALRAHVRAVLATTVSLLIDEAQPNLVSMTTHSADLPSNALTKFWDICAVFRAKRFTAGKANSYHGRHIWMMTR